METNFFWDTHKSIRTSGLASIAAEETTQIMGDKRGTTVVEQHKQLQQQRQQSKQRQQQQ